MGYKVQYLKRLWISSKYRMFKVETKVGIKQLQVQYTYKKKKNQQLV